MTSEANQMPAPMPRMKDPATNALVRFENESDEDVDAGLLLFLGGRPPRPPSFSEKDEKDGGASYVEGSGRERRAVLLSLSTSRSALTRLERS